MKKPIIYMLLAGTMLAADPKPAPKVDPEAKAAWYRAIAIQQMDLRAKSEAQLTLNRVSPQVEHAEQAAVDEAYDKLCPKDSKVSFDAKNEPACEISVPADKPKVEAK